VAYYLPVAMQSIPPSLWEGLFQQPQAAPMPSAGLSLLPQMFEKQRQDMTPKTIDREINPGITWGGKDRNAIMPNDLMRLYFEGRPAEDL
jgi:hypothetical protein